MTQAQLEQALRHLSWADGHLRSAEEMIRADPTEAHWIRKMRIVLVNRRQKLAARARKESV